MTSSELPPTRPQAAGETAPIERLGRFRIIAELGRGGMGVVYRAHDPNLDRDVALKVLRDGGDGARLQREAELAAALTHPNLIAVHEVGSARGPGGDLVRYIAMALIDGRPLDDAVAGLDREARVRLLTDIARGVGVAHAAGVVHRDLKPANILVTADGRPVVTDFGLARGLEQTRLTRTGEQVGTLAWMAPEQVRGEAGTPATDVWALGVLLYELLAGRRPFGGDVPAVVQHAILERPPRRLPADVPAALAAICRLALSKRAADRYPTARELADDLDRWQAGEPPTATRTRIGRGRGLGTRGRVGLGLLLLAVVLFVPPAVRDWRARRQRERLRRTATAALEAGDWETALEASRRALRLGDDAQLTRLAALAERHRAALADARDQLPGRIRSARALDAIVVALAREIEAVRVATYRADADPRPGLAALARTLAERQTAARTEDARHARLWTELGLGWRLVGRTREAREALERALALEDDDARAHYLLGRLDLEQATLERLRIRSAGRPSGHERVPALSRAGVAHIQRAMASALWSAPIDRHVAQTFAALAADRRDEVERLAADGLARFAGQRGCEDLWALRGCVARDATDAIRAWDASLTLRPHNAWVRVLRGARQHAAGRTEAGLADLDRALGLDPRLALAYVNRAVVRIALGHVKSARLDLDRAIELDPESPEAFSNRGAVRYRTGDLPGAVADFGRAIALHGEFAGAWANRGLARLDLGQTAAALADLERAVALDPDDAATVGNRGMAHARSGDLISAIRDLDRAIALDPRFQRAYANRGVAKMQLGDLAGALRDLDRAIELDPAHGPSVYSRAAARSQTGDLAGARADVDRAIALDPEYARAWRLRGRLHKRARRYSEAEQDLGSAISLAPRDPLAYRYRGEVRCAMGQLQAGVADLDRALRLNPRDIRGYLSRAAALVQLSQPGRAEADYTRVLELAPDSVPALVSRAAARQLRRNLPGARADLDRALALDPRNTLAHLNRGNLRLQTGDRAGAEADYRRAGELDPRCWRAWANLGSLWGRAGRYDEGIAAYLKALAVAPDREKGELEANVGYLQRRKKERGR